MTSSEKNYHDGMQLTYILHKQNRRSIAVGVSDHGEVFVRAPDWMRRKEIEDYLWSKERWIKKRMINVKESQHVLDMLYKDGEILYLGGILKVVARPHVRARIVDKELLVDSRKNMEDQIYKVLKTSAREVIGDFISELEPIMGVRVKSFRLKDNSTNWGSASGQKNLNFNWRIIMAPLEVVRYLVIHEMAHIKHMDHSNRYWAFVEQFDTDYENNDKWLKVNGALLRVV